MQSLKKQRNVSENKTRHRMLKRAFCALFFSLASAAVSLYLLKYNGLLFDNRPNRLDYPCRGAYISQVCGKVNWKTFVNENVDFCYIRLTAGAAFADRQASDNLKGASGCGMTFGVVHDLDPAVGGRAQADSFLSEAGSFEGMLIPALDIRLSLVERIRYGDRYKLAGIITDFVGRIKECESCGVVLLCDSYIYDLLSLGESGALIWADNTGLCSRPYLQSYSDKAVSPSMNDKYTALTAGKNITSRELYDNYTVRKK